VEAGGGRAPEFLLTWHLAGVSGFRPVFSPQARETWTNGSVEPYEFDGDAVNLTPGACLVTRGGVYTDFVLCGAVRRFRGEGPVVIRLRHAALGAYNIVIGPQCGVVYDRGSNQPVDRLWTGTAEHDLADWVPVQIAHNAGTLHVMIGEERSGPLAGVRIGSTEILLKAEACFAGVRDLVAGRKRPAGAPAPAGPPAVP
jgi:hypothetical protein